ncbi:hypothetical protein [Pseudoduganella sp. RAF53_2]|jgi:hypothetical protein|uniref:hypothetical protein n=1 Tax=unclassified Pseudoduganella TaxID=2637179 RepID=UPI003F98EB63
MNIQKHMEAIFISVLTIIGLGTLATENLPKVFEKAPVAASTMASPSNVAVVVIRAPRPSGRT